MRPVKPTNSENLAGGLFSSLRPQTSRADGIPTPKYHTHLDASTCCPPSRVLDNGVAPEVPSVAFSSSCNLWFARSLRAERRAILSSLETLRRMLPVASDKSRAREENRHVVAIAWSGIFLVNTSRLAIGIYLVWEPRKDENDKLRFGLVTGFGYSVVPITNHVRLYRCGVRPCNPLTGTMARRSQFPFSTIEKAKSWLSQEQVPDK